MLIDYRCSETGKSPQRLYDVLSSFGGSRGMFAWNSLWRFRGWLDRCIGGGKNRLDTRGQNLLKEGRGIDFFHVELLDQNRRIRLKTDMKLPGEAWLEFGIERSEAGSILHHVVLYEPRGLLGLVYWYASYPIHALVFRGMHKAILRQVGSSNENSPVEVPLLLSH